MEIIDRLELIFDWYRRAVWQETGCFFYVYDPVRDVVVGDGSPIRDVATIWDVEMLGQFLDRYDLVPIAERCLSRWGESLRERDGVLVFDEVGLGEPPSIAHSAFMALALLSSKHPGRKRIVERLTAGILRQQRADGSYRIHFGAEPDEGVEFYPGEAMLALMEAYRAGAPAERAAAGAQLLASVERGFAWNEARNAGGANVDADLLVFFANWQSQAIAALAAETHDTALAARARAYVFGLHDAIVASGFYGGVARHPERQATVEVACALEGLAEAYGLAKQGGDARRGETYADAIRVLLAFLFRAQRVEDCTERERGGFGHSLRDRTQRIDVTGHVQAGFIKSIRNGVV